jgi:hypothetical protein
VMALLIFFSFLGFNCDGVSRANFDEVDEQHIHINFQGTKYIFHMKSTLI